MKTLILGATGLVGGILLKKQLEDAAFQEVSVLVRRPLNPSDFQNNSKLRVHQGGFDELDKLASDSDLFDCDAIFCCLGSTIKKAGSKDEFKKIDYSYPLKAAKLLKEKNPNASFYLISAMGADPQSKIFYNQVKGEIEEELKKLNLKKLAIFRPSLILGQRSESRPAEALGQILAKAIDPLLSLLVPQYAGVDAEKIADAMILSSKDQKLGNSLFLSDKIKKL